MSGYLFDRQKASEAQAKYCEIKGYPRFVPLDGWCWACHRNIYDKVGHTMSNGENYYTGITVEGAGSYLITGCPHCKRSYCD